MRTTDLTDLMNIVESIRRDRHPDLDAAFLEAVVRAEKDSPEDDSQAFRDIQLALKAVLQRKGVE